MARCSIGALQDKTGANKSNKEEEWFSEMVDDKNVEHQDLGDDKAQQADETSLPAEAEKQDATPEKERKPRSVADRQLKLPDELAQYAPPILPSEPADQPQESALTAVPVEPIPQRQALSEQERQTRQFSLILPMGELVKRWVLIDFLAEHLNVGTLAAERRIVLGKGILLRDLGYDAARKLQARFRQAGQEVLVVAQHPGLEFGPPQEIFAIGLSGSTLEVLTSVERIRVPREQVILIGCGGVRMAPGVLTSKNVIDLFCQNPQYHFRIWETTFNFKSVPFASGALGEENFLNLATCLVKELPRAKGTPQLIVVIGKRLLSPQVFESLEEYDHYNQWVLWNHYGEKV
jgi:hypothetical protein